MNKFIKDIRQKLGLTQEEFAKKIIRENPDIVAFSCYIWNITKTLEICRNIKQKLGCTIILGGPEVAYRPKDILEKYEFVDFVLSGEGTMEDLETSPEKPTYIRQNIKELYEELMG